MNDKESPFNLFSSSGKKTPSKTKQVAAIKKALQEEPPPNDPQTAQMLNQIQEMQNSLKSRLDYISNKSGMSKEDLLKLISSMPGSQHEMEKMKLELKAFTEKIWNTVKTEGVEKKPALTSKERKAKTLGARRNWMRMP